MKIMIIEKNGKYKNHHIPVGSILLQTENGIVYVCENFHNEKDDFVHVWIWNKKQWCYVLANNNYTDSMRKFYYEELRKRKRKSKHDRRHKGSGSGQRLGFTGTVTDYECTKNPLHDFRRSMYV
jgi:hypothetical protein